MGVKSSLAGNLFVMASVLGFVQAAVGLIFFGEELVALVAGVFGVFFLLGAIFAYRGTVIPIFQERSWGTDFSTQTGEFEAACYCGLLGPLAIILSFVLIFVVSDMDLTSLPFIAPGVIGGLIATIAGIIVLRVARKSNLGQTRY